MLKNLYILLFGLIAFIASAQNETNIWYFGHNAGLDFNDGTPTVLLDGALDTNEGCATISDSTGQLLFYTEGVTVYNRNHNVMLNGTGLHGSPSSTHSAIIVPKPEDNDIYYIFTVDEVGGPHGLQYSEVDMTLDNGLGGVTFNKNLLLSTPVNEKITAVKNSETDGFWVVSHRFNSNEFIVFEVTANGVSTTPIVTAIGSQTGFLNVAGQIKISPNGTKLAVATGAEAQLFDFNITNGAITNPIILNPSVSSYGVEFSPDSNLLYISFYTGVYQYNLNAGSASDIINSQVTLISSPEPFSSLQLGPDNRIYVAKNQSPFLDIIENPNLLGLACGYQYDSLYLEGRISALGLPTFIQSFFLVRFQVENTCYGEGSVFNANISQPYESIHWNFGDGNTSTDENPVHTYATAGEYEVQLTVTANGQTFIEVKTITIYEPPNVNTVVSLQQCDDDVDGFTVFNLNEAKTLISANSSHETITFYETQEDAEVPANPITNVAGYINQIVSSDIIWARNENSGGCFNISQLNLLVSTTQIPADFTRDFYQCDDGISTSDGVATFDFNSVDAEIQALFPAGQQLVIKYYRNQSEALSETNPIENTASFQNTGYPHTQNIYIRVDGVNGCLGLGHHITLHVEPIPVAYPVPVFQGCDDNGDGVFEFDTSTIETIILNGQTNATISYTDENGNILPNPLPNPLITATQMITARIVNSTSLDTEGACYDETEINFIVNAAVVAHNIPEFIACDTDQDGFFSFTTSNVETQLLNGQSGLTVTYTDETGSVLSSPLPNPFNTTTQTITARVENPLNSICYDETTINFTVSATPTVNTIQSVMVCDDLSNDGVEYFTLSDFDEQILNGQSNTLFQIKYFETHTDAENNINPLPDNYQVTSASQSIYARIHNSNNINCYEITVFELGVLNTPVAYQPNNLHVCDDQSNDGIASFDLSLQDVNILNGQSAVNNILSYFITQEDANNNVNALVIPFTNSQNPQTIYARLENIDSEHCYSTTSFEIYVKEQPNLLIEDQWFICENGIIELTADAGYDEYLWSTGEMTQSITVSNPGDYVLTLANVYGDLRCETSKTITVSESRIATIIDIETIDFTQNNNSIIIFIEGQGNYEYSLDGITYQDNNQFSNLYIDDYIVYVRDKGGCGISTEEIYLLFYPKFFTPNNDGFNDTWQLINATKEPNNIIYVFDKYGKLLKQLSPADNGWDGTINGIKLPSDDYWFVLHRQNGKQYNGHFTLKR